VVRIARELLLLSSCTLDVRKGEGGEGVRWEGGPATSVMMCSVRPRLWLAHTRALLLGTAVVWNGGDCGEGDPAEGGRGGDHLRIRGPLGKRGRKDIS
jgi:hypothetical protein